MIAAPPVRRAASTRSWSSVVLKLASCATSPARLGSSSAERVEFGLEFVDGSLHLGAGGEQFVDGLLATHLDVGGGVGVWRRWQRWWRWRRGR